MPDRIPILDHGSLELVESWGSDERVIEAARTSTQGGFVSWEPYPGHPKGDMGLLAYLATSEPKHTTPFEMCGLTVIVEAPIVVFREWMRSRSLCLGPDTLIHFDATRSQGNRRISYKMRIEDVWKKWQPTICTSRPERQTNALFPRSQIRAKRLRCLDEREGEFGHTSIIDVIKGEPKPMVRVTVASGKRLTATREHRVVTSEGWRTLGDAIDGGLLLATEGTTRSKASGWEVPPVDPATELWRPVAGWESYYQVSDAGRVRRIDGARRREPKRHTVGPIGYPVVALNRPGIQETRTIHRLVLRAFTPPEEWAEEVRHKDHNRLDCRLSNLEWGSALDNATDRMKADRNQRLVTVYEDIVSVEDAGVLPSFDLTVDGPWHNFVADGFVVHNSYNEASARYAPLPDLNYVPTVERLMVPLGKNKQANPLDGAPELTGTTARRWLDDLEYTYTICQRTYERGLAAGVPKELARLCLPVGRYSRMMASGNLLNWIRFLTLRMDAKAMHEIQLYARAVGALIAERFPRTWELFGLGRAEA